MEKNKQNKMIRKVLLDMKKNCGASDKPLEYHQELLVEYEIKKTIEIMEKQE